MFDGVPSSSCQNGSRWTDSHACAMRPLLQIAFELPSTLGDVRGFTRMWCQKVGREPCAWPGFADETGYSGAVEIERLSRARDQPEDSFPINSGYRVPTEQ